jgi:hypothetical protein
LTETSSLGTKHTNRKSRGGSRNAPKTVLERRIAHVERQLATRIVNPKYIVTNLSAGTLVNSTPVITCVNAVAQGTDETNRIGDICKMQWAELSLNFLAGNTFIAGSFGLRVMLVSETTALGAVVAPAQFFSTATPQAIQLRNYVSRDDKRFHVWWDSGPKLIGPTSFALNTAVNTYGVPPQIEMVLPRINLNNLRTDYSRGNSGTITDIDTNALSLLVFTDNTNANYITYNIGVIVQFLD